MLTVGIALADLGFVAITACEVVFIIQTKELRKTVKCGVKYKNIDLLRNKMDVHVELSEKEQVDFITEWDRIKTPKDHLQSNLLIAMVYSGVGLILLDDYL